MTGEVGSVASALASVDWDAITGRAPHQIAWHTVRRRVAGRRVLVTGAAGSLGAPLSLALASAGPSLLILVDFHEGTLFQLREALVSSYPDVPLHAVLADVRHTRRVQRVFAKDCPELVFHLAAYKHVPWGEEDPEAFVEANVLGAQAIIEAARFAGTGHIVYPSTDKAIDPPSLYGATKRVVETMLYAAAEEIDGPRCTVVRFVNVLGSRGSAPETFARQVASGQPLSVTDTEMRRYWITPDHAKLLLLHAACIDERATTIAPDAGDEMPVIEIAQRVARALRPGASMPEIRVTGLRPGERLSEPLIARHERIERVALPGILVVRGGTTPSGADVAASVSQLERLLAEDAGPSALREAVMGAAKAVQPAT
jgi:FlaA1/EpsC-like NDP-sugar epimerase